ncbi:BlaI/MecI/CopY family transcriptional regulator [Taibaiella soli]|uniref:BlaI/MecI/CopY family transcriptional regulator n=1 Tax=Taibaiella soli TaxID=1649169 RepID=A0A2W2AWX0_9BACT|nr:BlaI/MecI/CopY family transcriptional regulator [Taibaiella soli]
MPQLTKAEERVMQALWQQDNNTILIRDIITVMPAPKPHANTVNTILKILTEKGFVAIEPLGNANAFRPLVSKKEYSSRSITQIVKGYFDGSFADMISFFVADKNLDIKELESIVQSLKKKKQ